MGSAAGDRLLWRCRRGMKELDLLLERFVREHYPDAPANQKRAFERLLDLPDPALAALLLGPPAPSGTADPLFADRDLAELVALVAAPRRR